jgi:hypothetical protein
MHEPIPPDLELTAYTCPFDRAILRGTCTCTQARSYHVAERHGVGCTGETAQARCMDFERLLIERARFALKLRGTRITAAQALRIQHGGLLGLQQILRPEADARFVFDIHSLLDQAMHEFQQLDRLPFAGIVKTIATWNPRPARKKS